MNRTAINVVTIEAFGMKKLYFQPLKLKNLLNPIVFDFPQK